MNPTITNLFNLFGMHVITVAEAADHILCYTDRRLLLHEIFNVRVNTYEFF